MRKGVKQMEFGILGIDTKKFIQHKYDWIKFCKEKNITVLEDYKKLCKIYDVLPINPGDFYTIFSSITIELNLSVKRRK